MGGPQNISRGLIKTIERAGGRVLVNAPVDKVNVERGRATGVTLKNGALVTAPLVVSAAGAEATAKFLPRYGVPKELGGGISHMSLGRLSWEKTAGVVSFSNECDSSKMDQRCGRLRCPIVSAEEVHCL